MPDRVNPLSPDAEQEALMRALSDTQAPPPPHVRNINLDTHVGHAPNRPYALIEDQLARTGNGWRSYDELKAALKGAGDKPGNTLQVDEFGDHYRMVPDGNAEPERRMVNGRLELGRPLARRYVALTQQQAQAASQSGRETDFWNGGTWMRRGIKPELDVAVMLAQANRPSSPEDIVWEDAPSSEQALHQAAAFQRQALLPAVIEARPADEKPAPKAADSKGKGD